MVRASDMVQSVHLTPYPCTPSETMDYRGGKPKQHLWTPIWVDAI